ncbi:MAG TPA: sec-independent translocase [Streptosporangiaceae bacterium]|nr:sec-independent translocase [Streptosporangiaceae bacterium]
MSITKLLILAVLGLMIFGPDQLPKIAAQAGKALRDLRRLAESAKSDLTDSLGPEFRDFDFNDLNPKSFVRKHLLEDFDDDDFSWSGSNGVITPDALDPASTASSGYDHSSSFLIHDTPPFDAEAT